MNLQQTLDAFDLRLHRLEARRQQERVIALDLPNGEKITAPVGIWFLVWAKIMDEKLRIKLCETLKEIQEEHIKANPLINNSTRPGLQEKQGVVTHTDFVVDGKGKKHYTMHCEPGVMGTKW